MAEVTTPCSRAAATRWQNGPFRAGSQPPRGQAAPLQLPQGALPGLQQGGQLGLHLDTIVNGYQSETISVLKRLHKGRQGQPGHLEFELSHAQRVVHYKGGRHGLASAGKIRCRSLGAQEHIQLTGSG